MPIPPYNIPSVNAREAGLILVMRIRIGWVICLPNVADQLHLLASGTRACPSRRSARSAVRTGVSCIGLFDLSVLLGFLIFKVDVILTFSRWIVLQASLTRWSIRIHSCQRRDRQSCPSQIRLPLPPFPMSLGSAELDITSSLNRHSILLCHMFGKGIQTAHRCAI